MQIDILRVLVDIYIYYTTSSSVSLSHHSMLSDDDSIPSSATPAHPHSCTPSTCVPCSDFGSALALAGDSVPALHVACILALALTLPAASTALERRQRCRSRCDVQVNRAKEG